MINKLIATTVIRGAQRGESHGALYLVDVESNKIQQMLDWKAEINWEGDGGERGLRGVAAGGGGVFVASSDELFVFNPKFERIGSFQNPYLKNCHGISLHKGLLFLTSTGFDSILVFDPAARKFVAGLNLARDDQSFRAIIFDPNQKGGPKPGNQSHLNSIHVEDNGMYVAGRKLDQLLRVLDNQVTSVAPVPAHTSNVRPFARGLLINSVDQLRWVGPTETVTFDIPRSNQKEFLDAKDAAIARKAFARGICLLSDNVVAGGSSPSTISVYDLDKRERVKSINLTTDVRSAVHSLALWPY